MGNKPICVAPWVNITLDQHGTLLPCCKTRRDNNETNSIYDAGSIRNAWNSDLMKEIRKKLARHEWHDVCKQCKYLHERGMNSYFSLFHWLANIDEDIDYSREDGSADFNVKILDIRFDNKCNLACRMCGPKASTAWYKDAIILQDKSIPSPPFVSLADRINIVDQIIDLSESLEAMCIIGGEPLMSDQHWETLTRLADMQRTNIWLMYNTNLTSLTYKSYNALDVWSKFKKVTVNVSLDSIGGRNSYIRHGSDWDQILQNITLVQQLPNVEIKIHSTVTALSVFELPDLYDLLMARFGLAPHQLHATIVDRPTYYSTSVLPMEMRSHLQHKYNNFIDNITKRGADQGKISHWRGIVQHLSAPQDLDGLEEFKRVTKILDDLRGESVLDVFPELACLWTKETPY